MADTRAFVDLHCHTNASFDSLASPAAVVHAAAARGITHLAITDHDRIDGALRARDASPDDLTVIVGEEVKTTQGDLIALFIERPVESGRPVDETITDIRAQGGLVGIPHPFDRLRNSLAHANDLLPLVGKVDWIEGYNARLFGGSGNQQAAEFGRQHGVPIVAVSDAHTTLEVGVAYVALSMPPSTPAALLAGLATAELVVGRASYAVRFMTPVAKAVQRLRGNGRMRAPTRG